MANAPRDATRILRARDVADLLGVSTSMISRAFNPQASISPAMRKRIMEAAEALGYRPNVIASSLSTRRSKIVAVILGTLENPFYAQVLERLSRELQTAGYQSLLFNLAPGQDVDSQLPYLLQYNVDAVIIVSASISSGIANDWTNSGRKVILFNRTLPNMPVPSVCCDNQQGARLAVDHFVATGRERLAFAAGRRDTSTNAERELGFLARLAEVGAKLAGKVDNPHCSFHDGYSAALKLAPAQPDAIFFANDVMALGGVEAIEKELKLRVPEDIAVIGFDDIPMAAWPTYSLTTLHPPLDEMVASAVRLLSVPEGSDENTRIIQPVTLVVRDSTRPREIAE